MTRCDGAGGDDDDAAADDDDDDDDDDIDIHIIHASDTCCLMILMWVQQCHKPLIFDGWNPNHKNGDEWGMVYCYTHINGWSDHCYPEVKMCGTPLP